jgi:hypothetical protein
MARKSLQFWSNGARVLAVNDQKRGANMTETDQKTLLAIQGDARAAVDRNAVATRRGMPVYRSNPSIPGSANGLATRQRRIEVPGGKAAVLVDNGTGEIRGIGGMGFWWQEEVDASRFVKLFLEGIKQAAGLSKSGMAVFELVYGQMRERHGNDKIELSQYTARDYGLSERTFRRGLRELLEKQFLYRSTSDGVFFINIRFMFNGDRLAFVKTYHLKGAGRQQELPFAETAPALPFAATNE